MAKRPMGTELIVLGDLNVDLKKAGGRGRDEEISLTLATAGLEDIVGHFLPRWRAWCKYWRTWAVVSHGRVVRSRMDYILGSERRIF